MTKLLAALLAVCLLLSLCACGSSTATTTETSETPAETTAETTTSEAPAAAAEQEIQPAATEEAPAAEQETPAEEPEEIENIYPLDGSPTFTVWTAFQTRMENVINGYEDWVAFQLAEEKTGVHIDWIQIAQNQVNEQFTLMVASNEYADMCRGFSGYYTNGVADAYDQEIILDLTDLIAENMPNYNAALDENPQYRKDLSTEDGMMLYINTVQTENYTMNGNVIRQDWLDALGLEMPKTMDDLEEVLLAFKNEYGISNALLVNQGNYGDILTKGFNTLGSSEMGNVYYAQDGTVKCSLLDDGLRDYLVTMNRYYEEGLFDSDFISRSSNPKDANVIQMIATGQTGMFNTSISIWTSILEASTDPNMKLAAMPITMVNEGDVTHFYDQYQIGSGSVSLFNGCSDPETACKWLDWFYSEEGSNIMCYGVEGESYNLDDSGKPQWDMLELEAKAEEYGTTANTVAEFYYGIKGNFVCLAQSDCLFGFYTDEMLEGIEVYADESQYGDNWNFSNYMSLSSEESAAIATRKTDIATYATTEITKFITGEADIATEWDAYKANVEAMGVQDVIDVYQSCYDKFQQR
jgi:putative aldouronate transport system substrate-binding protein